MKAMKSSEDNRPVYVKKVGSVRCAVFLGGPNRNFYNITVARTYKDGDEYRETNSLNGLADVACLREALRHIADWLSASDDDREAND